MGESSPKAEPARRIGRNSTIDTRQDLPDCQGNPNNGDRHVRGGNGRTCGAPGDSKRRHAEQNALLFLLLQVAASGEKADFWPCQRLHLRRMRKSMQCDHRWSVAKVEIPFSGTTAHRTPATATRANRGNTPRQGQSAPASRRSVTVSRGELGRDRGCIGSLTPICLGAVYMKAPHAPAWLR